MTRAMEQLNCNTTKPFGEWGNLLFGVFPSNLTGLKEDNKCGRCRRKSGNTRQPPSAAKPAVWKGRLIWLSVSELKAGKANWAKTMDNKKAIETSINDSARNWMIRSLRCERWLSEYLPHEPFFLNGPCEVDKVDTGNRHDERRWCQTTDIFDEAAASFPFLISYKDANPSSAAGSLLWFSRSNHCPVSQYLYFGRQLCVRYSA